MDSENFFRRWAKRKSEVNAGRPPPEPEVRECAVAEPAKPVDTSGNLPQPSLTLADVAALNADSDYSVFLAEGVHSTVRRAALKKLFSNPGFHVIDGLDIHMEDYNKTTPIPPAMLAALRHTQSLFKSMAALEKTEAGEAGEAAAGTYGAEQADSNSGAPGGGAAPALPDGDMGQGKEDADGGIHDGTASDVHSND